MAGPSNSHAPPHPHSANAMPPPPPPLSSHFDRNPYAMRSNSPPAEYLAAMNIDPIRGKHAQLDATAISPSVRLELPVIFEGFTLRKDMHPPFGETPSWSRVKEVRIAATTDELSKRVQKKGKNHDFLKDYQSLRSGRQRVLLDRLIDDKRRSERDPTVEWVIASIDEERGSQEKRRNATETKALHIILKRRSKSVAKAAKKIDPTKPDRHQRASAPPTFGTWPNNQFNYQSMYGGPTVGNLTGGNSVNATFNASQPGGKLSPRQPQQQNKARPTTLPPILLSNEGRPQQQGTPGLDNFMPGAFPQDGFPEASFLSGTFAGGPMHSSAKPKVSPIGIPMNGFPKPEAPSRGNKSSGGKASSKSPPGAIPSTVNVLDGNDAMREYGTNLRQQKGKAGAPFGRNMLQGGALPSKRPPGAFPHSVDIVNGENSMHAVGPTSKQQRGKPGVLFGGNMFSGGALPSEIPPGAFPHYMNTVNREDPICGIGSTSKQQKGKSGAPFNGNIFAGDTLPSKTPPGAFPQFVDSVDEEDPIREYGSTSKQPKGKPTKTGPAPPSSWAKENPMFANILSASDSSDDESSDTSFHFSAGSVDLSTPLSSPTSTGVAIPLGYSNSKRQSYDFMTEIRDGKYQNQGKSRTRKDSRGVLEDLADIKQNRKPQHDPIDLELDEAQYRLPRPTGMKGSSVDDDGRASWRSSVTAVEALEQEYIRKLEHLRRAEVQQLDERLREAEEYEREREREREGEHEREHQHSNEMQWQRERERSRELNNGREGNRTQERYKEKERGPKRYNDRSPQPYGRRFYGDGEY